jgi:hypothetical protein
MPYDVTRGAVLRLILLLPLAMLMPPLATPARAQQEPAPSFENSIDRWNRMSPEERERELAKLPPARARLIRQRIRRYNQMGPGEQQMLRERYQEFSQLAPDTQQIVRGSLRSFRQLPPDRQVAVHRAVVEIRTLPEPQRQARLNSEEFRNRFSPPEQQIIRDLSTYLPK